MIDNYIMSRSSYFINRHNIITFSELMLSKRKPILKKLCHLIRAINTFCLSSRGRVLKSILRFVLRYVLGRFLGWS